MLPRTRFERKQRVLPGSYPASGEAKAYVGVSISAFSRPIGVIFSLVNCNPFTEAVDGGIRSPAWEATDDLLI